MKLAGLRSKRQTQQNGATDINYDNLIWELEFGLLKDPSVSELREIVLAMSKRITELELALARHQHSDLARY